MYPKHAIERLLFRIDILTVIRHYLGDSLKRRGRNPHEWVALCPFHVEKTPSFSVTTEKQFFNCFGCGTHGNAIRFVREYEGLDFHEAIKKIQDITKSYIASGRTDPKRRRQREREFLRRLKSKHRREEQQERENHNLRIKSRRLARSHIPF